MFNYYFDTDRGDNHLATVELFENIGSEINFGFSSTFVDYELKKAPEPKKSNILNLILKYNIIVLDYKKEIYNLSDIYIKE
jgi:hypothetical protein